MPVLGSSQWLRLTTETTWATRNASPAAGQQVWVRLTAGNSWVAEPMPEVGEVRGADGFNLRQERFGLRIMFPWALTTVLYPQQAAFFINAWMVPTGSPPVLTSFTADFWDGVEVRSRLGCRVERGSLRSNSRDGSLTMTLSGYAKDEDHPFTTLAQPAYTVFPSPRPYIHQDSAGLVQVGTGASPPIVVGYDNLEITGANKLDRRAFESARIVNCDYNGRDVDFSMQRLLRDNAQRLAFENQTTQHVIYNWTAPTAVFGSTPAYSINVDFKNADYLTGRDVDRNFDKSQDETLHYGAYVDPTSGLDTVVTVV